MADVKIDWNGKQVSKDVKTRMARGLNIGAGVGVQFTQEESPRDTGFMANTMEQIEEATPDKLSVKWGNQTAKYTIWVEIGARGRNGVHMITRSLVPAVKAVQRAVSK